MKKDIIYLAIIIALIATMGIAIVMIPKSFNITTKVVSEPSFVGTAGDVNRTARIHQVGITAATSTLCAIQNTDGRDRIITKPYVFHADDTLNGTMDMVLSIATSSLSSATTTGVTYLAKDIAWATTTPMGEYYSTTTAATSGDISLRIWPTNSYLLFKVMGKTVGASAMAATTSETITGFCGAEYYLDM